MLTSIKDAKRHFSQYIKQALAGEEVIIGHSGKPLVRLWFHTAFPTKLNHQKE